MLVVRVKLRTIPSLVTFVLKDMRAGIYLTGRTSVVVMAARVIAGGIIMKIYALGNAEKYHHCIFRMVR